MNIRSILRTSSDLTVKSGVAKVVSDRDILKVNDSINILFLAGLVHYISLLIHLYGKVYFQTLCVPSISFEAETFPLDKSHDFTITWRVHHGFVSYVYFLSLSIFFLN